MKQLFASITVLLAMGAAEAAGVDHPAAASLREVARSADKAWNERDANAMAAHYGDAATASIGTTYLSGKPALLEYFTNSFGKLPAGMTHRTEVRRIEQIGDLVAADTAVFLEVPDAETGRRTVREFFTVTLLRQAGKGWEFVAVRSAPVGK